MNNSPLKNFRKGVSNFKSEPKTMPTTRKLGSKTSISNMIPSICLVNTIATMIMTMRAAESWSEKQTCLIFAIVELFK
jgi:hypothetical protein